MKERPHGASVVPTVAVTMAMASLLAGTLGTSRPCAAAPQSGWASTPDATYARNTVDSSSRKCSTRWKLPRSTSSETITAAAGTLA